MRGSEGDEASDLTDSGVMHAIHSIAACVWKVARARGFDSQPGTIPVR